MAHGAGPTSNGNRVSVARWWCVCLTNTPYVPPRMCGGRVLLSGTRSGAEVKREPGPCWALQACPLNQHALRSAADVCVGGGVTEWHTGRGRRQTGTRSLPGAIGVSAQPTCPTFRRGCVWGAGIPEWHTGAGPTSDGNWVSAGRWWCVRSTNIPYVSPRMCGGRVLLSGTRGGADVKREPGLRRALVVCPPNQHTLRPAADGWGAGITEWHTGRVRRQTGTGSLSRVGGVSA